MLSNNIGPTQLQTFLPLPHVAPHHLDALDLLYPTFDTNHLHGLDPFVRCPWPRAAACYPTAKTIRLPASTFARPALVP